MNNLPTPFRSSPDLPAGPGMAVSFDGMAGPDERLTSPFDSLLRMLWQRKWLIVGITALFVALGVLLSLTTTPQFRAVARLQIDRATPDVVRVDALEGQGANDWEFYETQYELLRSRRLSAKVVDALALDDEVGFVLGAEATQEDLEAIDPERRREIAIGRVNRGTTVDPVEGSEIVDVAFSSTDPEYSAAVANALAEEFIEMDIEQKFEASARLRTFLEQKLEETREVLEESEREAADYAQGRGIVQTEASGLDGGSINQATLTRLNGELAAATAARVQAEAALRANRQGATAAASLGNTGLTQMRQERASLGVELAKLQSDFGPEYPAVVALKSQIAEMDDEISREQGRTGSSVTTQLRGDFNRAVRAESALRARVAQAKGTVLNEQQQQIGLNIIQRDIDTNRQLYDGLLEQYKAVGVSAASESNRISIVDTAQVPGGPYTPNIPMNLAIAFVLGLASSMALVLVLEQLRNSRLTPDTLPSKLRVPLLGNTPRIEQKKGAVASPQDAQALSEAYYSALTAMRFIQEQGLPKSVFVTSSRQYEGKSTTAAAIATDLAALGNRVVLMDIDLRAPSVHKIVEAQLDVGVADYLAGREQLASLVRKSETENLDLVFGGTPPPNPSQLLSSGRLEQLIAEAGEMYDYVVVDGPPVLGLADAPLIARAVAGTLFVVESNRTPASTARAAIDRLVSVNARIVGALITKYDPNKDGYGYSYGGGYGYGYGTPYQYGD
ncbi:polysaccharide biosynthesis tyrosine autokinase [Sphingomicrobium sp. XHP0239]|uniref:GumC family protein n=1 Tax=Sphingomicrobium maritimum TaxID=3133972 RepID=UPI0031CC4E11